MSNVYNNQTVSTLIIVADDSVDIIAGADSQWGQCPTINLKYVIILPKVFFKRFKTVLIIFKIYPHN